MNNMIVKLGIRLFLFCLIAAVALAITNEVTKGPIAAQALASKMAALNTVMPGCEYEQAELGELEEDSELDELFVAKDSSGTIYGYAITASPQGYGGEIPITFGVSADGYVTQVYVGSLQETAGLGSKVGEAAFKDQFIGIAADDTTLRNDVNIISGASISSNAFMRAAEDALQYSKNKLGIAPAPGDKEAILAAFKAANGGEEQPAEVETKKYNIEVRGFNYFTVDIEVDSNGKIVSVAVPENDETPGFGADLIADKAVFDALAGQDIAGAQIEVRSGATLTSNAINEALSKAAGGAAGGSGLKEYEVTGFAPFKVAVELDEAGKIVSVTIPSNEETPGLGADLLADAAVFDALVGQDVSGAKIDVRAGVTLTSNAVNDALAKAANDFGGGAAAPVIPGDPYTVKGMNKFTMYIELDGEKIASVTVPEHNETPGLGANLVTEEALAKLVGQSIKDARIDVVSGVTLTSNAINNALFMAAVANGFEAPPTVEEIKEESAEEAKTEPAAAPAETEKAEDANTKTFDVTGFQAFKVEVGVDADGKITSISVPANNETPGFGADLIADTAVFEALIGKEIKDAQIDVRTGATLTSNAINDALTQAAAAFGGAEKAAPAEEAKEEPAKETKEEASKAADTKTFDVTGFQAFKVEIGVDADGKITSISVPENNETPGFGADLIADTAVFEALIGKEIKGAQIDVRSGATLTSNAINDALTQAAAAFGGAEEAAPAEEAKEEPAKETKEEAAKAADTKTFDVTGFQAFKVEIGVDADGKITSISVPENNETPGFGADLIADTAVFEALIGKEIKDVQIDVRSGATLTSNAINDALTQAAAAFGGAEEAAPAEETKEEPAEEPKAKAVEEAKEEPAKETKEEAAKAADTKSFDVTGFQTFKVEIGVDADGKITSISVPENNETPGFGADLIADTAVFEALIGKEIKGAQIDVRSGATLTSNAINDALTQAAAAFGGAEEAAPAEEPKAEAAEEAKAEAAEEAKAEPAKEPKEEAAKAAETKSFDVTGFQSFKVEIGVDADGKITSISIPENNETPGFGADLIADTAVFETLIGKDVKSAQIDVRSGATLTSNAINDALTQAAAAFGGAEEAAPAEETKKEAAEVQETKSFEVTGFQAFKVEIGVDANGKITSIVIPENNETPGFGADLIADTAVFEALIGKDIKDAQIDVRSGATLTSNAINEALKKASEEVGK